jgi:hypothetical protein
VQAEDMTDQEAIIKGPGEGHWKRNKILFLPELVSFYFLTYFATVSQSVTALSPFGTRDQILTVIRKLRD